MSSNNSLKSAWTFFSEQNVTYRGLLLFGIAAFLSRFRFNVDRINRPALTSYRNFLTESTNLTRI